MEPQDRRYTREHEWVQPEGEGVRVGITDYAQTEVGRRLKAHEVFGTVESVKAVSELFAPLSGEVVEVNAALTGNPEKINSDPYGEAWMIVVKPSAPGEMADLLDAAAYQAYVESESK
jgi:glycine cleavage system H protein